MEWINVKDYLPFPHRRGGGANLLNCGGWLRGALPPFPPVDADLDYMYNFTLKRKKCVWKIDLFLTILNNILPYLSDFSDFQRHLKLLYCQFLFVRLLSKRLFYLGSRLLNRIRVDTIPSLLKGKQGYFHKCKHVGIKCPSFIVKIFDFQITLPPISQFKNKSFNFIFSYWILKISLPSILRVKNKNWNFI